MFLKRLQVVPFVFLQYFFFIILQLCYYHNNDTTIRITSSIDNYQFVVHAAGAAAFVDTRQIPKRIITTVTTTTKARSRTTIGFIRPPNLLIKKEHSVVRRGMSYSLTTTTTKRTKTTILQYTKDVDDNNHEKKSTDTKQIKTTKKLKQPIVYFVNDHQGLVQRAVSIYNQYNQRQQEEGSNPIISSSSSNQSVKQDEEKQQQQQQQLDLSFERPMLEKKEKEKKKVQVFIGIGGGPGSGKSTIATKLCKMINTTTKLRCKVISMDGYHIPKKELHEMTLPPTTTTITTAVLPTAVPTTETTRTKTTTTSSPFEDDVVDGNHPAAITNTTTTTFGSEMVPLWNDQKDVPLDWFVKRRGAPWTFDSEKFVQDLQELSMNQYGSFPIYDRSIGDPVYDDSNDESNITTDDDIILVEGNYVLCYTNDFDRTQLNKEKNRSDMDQQMLKQQQQQQQQYMYQLKDWSGLEKILHDKWYLNIEIQILQQRLESRHGRNWNQDKIRWYGPGLQGIQKKIQSSDLYNARFVQSNSIQHADVIVILSSEEKRKKKTMK